MESTGMSGFSGAKAHDDRGREEWGQGYDSADLAQFDDGQMRLAAMMGDVQFELRGVLAANDEAGRIPFCSGRVGDARGGRSGSPR